MILISIGPLNIFMYLMLNRYFNVLLIISCTCMNIFFVLEFDFKPGWAAITKKIKNGLYVLAQSKDSDVDFKEKDQGSK